MRTVSLAAAALATITLAPAAAAGTPSVPAAPSQPAVGTPGAGSLSPVGPSAPALPAQPGLPPAGCTSLPTRGGQWTLLSANTGPLQIAVDPQTPCRMYGTNSSTALLRTTDRWQTSAVVFNDTQQSVPVALPVAGCIGNCLTTFSASSMAIADGGRIWLGEWGNGDAAVTSADGGTNWLLRDQGVDRQRVSSVVSSRDGRTVYALVVGPSIAPYEGTQPIELYVTEDAGSSWTQAAFPVNAVSAQWAGVQIAIDPANARHAWALASLGPVGGTGASSANQSTQWHLYESTDAAGRWADRGPLPLGQGYTLTAIHSGLHPGRLLVTGQFNTIASRVAVSDDDGSTWVASRYPQQLPSSTPYLAVDPADNDRIFIAEIGSGGLAMAASTDGLNTFVPVSSPTWWPCSGAQGDYCSAQTGPLPNRSVLSADDYGNFYVSLLVSCSKAYGPVCPGQAQPTFLAGYTVASQPGALLAQQPPGLPTGPGSPQLLQPPQAQATCQVPVPAASSPFAQAATSNPAGTVAFDGHELLYTNTLDRAGPGLGVIHALLPPGCTPLGDIDVAFTPQDVATWATANSITPAQAWQCLWIDDIVYDAHRNALWASLGCGSTVGGTPAIGLFRITVNPGGGPLRMAQAKLAFLAGCGVALAYDNSRDTLWTCDSGPPGNGLPGTPTEIDASTGAAVPSCAKSIGSYFTAQVTTQSQTKSGPSMWTLISPDRLLVQTEDDSTMVVYDTATCAPVSTFAHRTASEALQEDDEMSCDTLTYGVGGLVPSSGPVGVMWIRDANAFLLTPYVVPAASCAMPTATAYRGPPTAAVGTRVNLCAALNQLYPGGATPLQGMPINFTVRGAGITRTVASEITTGPSAMACATWTANVPAGRYAVTASFDPAQAGPGRTAQYLPSEAAGSLAMTLRALVPPAPRLALLIGQSGSPANPPGAPNPPPPQTAPVGQAQAAEQAQAEAQVQSQSQAQQVVQAQPGMMVARRTQQQVQVQNTRVGQTDSDTMLAVRRAPQPPGIVPLMAASLLLSLGCLARRPQRSAENRPAPVSTTWAAPASARRRSSAPSRATPARCGRRARPSTGR